MDKPDRPLRLVSQTDAPTVRRRLQAKEYTLLKAVLEAEDDVSLCAAFRALFDYLETDIRVVAPAPASAPEGGRGMRDRKAATAGHAPSSREGPGETRHDRSVPRRSNRRASRVLAALAAIHEEAGVEAARRAFVAYRRRGGPR